ncbi:MAG: hypothetical protein P8Z40_17145 [Chloroflexota bacterium]
MGVAVGVDVGAGVLVGSGEGVGGAVSLTTVEGAVGTGCAQALNSNTSAAIG